MSVYPEFLEYIHEVGMYVPGHNYEEMYNIMIYNLTHNIISTNNFIYTYAFMNQLYDYLEELLLPDTETDEETNNLPINNINIMNNSNNINIINNSNNMNTQNQNQNQNQNDPIFHQIFNYYNITPNQPLTNEYINNNTNEFTYTNLVYYNNT
jgi:hypothetical protein